VTITLLDLAFLLAMLFAFVFVSSWEHRSEIRTRERLAQCTAEAETLADACEGR
jgi:hypothetical protein